MVKIRLTRKGNHKRPFYRVVVAESSARRDGRFIDIVGTYDPVAKPAAIEVKAESVLHWLSKGAQPTDTVRQILKKSGVWSHWQDVQAGKAQIGDLEGRLGGSIERNRTDRPSKKAVAKIAEEQAAKAEAAASEAESDAEGEAEGEGAEEAAEESAS